MSIPSFADIAKKWDIDWCSHEGVWDRDAEGNFTYRRTCPEGEVGRHYFGFTEPSIGRVHFNDRKPTRRGIRNFLMLIAEVYLSHNRGQPNWLRLYETNTWADKEAHKINLRFPISWSRTARFYVRAVLLWEGREPYTGPVDYDAIWKWTEEV